MAFPFLITCECLPSSKRLLRVHIPTILFKPGHYLFVYYENTHTCVAYSKYPLKSKRAICEGVKTRFVCIRSSINAFAIFVFRKELFTLQLKLPTCPHEQSRIKSSRLPGVSYSPDSCESSSILVLIPSTPSPPSHLPLPAPHIHLSFLFSTPFQPPIFPVAETSALYVVSGTAIYKETIQVHSDAVPQEKLQFII